MKMNVKHQGGWVASFVIVGILLTFAVLGGLYWLKANQKQVAKTDTTKSQSTSNTAKTSPNDKKSANDSPSTQKDEEKGEVIDTNQVAKKEDAAASTPQAPAPSTQTAPAASAAPAASSAPTTPASSGAAKGPLPTTGPEDIFAQLVAVAILAFSAATYVRSRQAA
jgi:cytoskeletal protein RodZ